MEREAARLPRPRLSALQAGQRSFPNLPSWATAPVLQAPRGMLTAYPRPHGLTSPRDRLMMM